MKNVKKTILNKFKLLIGSNEEFKIEHQILNTFILIVTAAYLYTLPHNFFFDLPLVITLINFISVLIFCFILYLSRIKKWYSGAAILFFITLYITLSVNWFLNGGLSGSVPCFYFVLIAYIVFLTQKTLRIILIVIFFINITLLFKLEYHLPALVVLYENKQKQFIDVYVSSIVAIILISLLVYVAKKLYNQEKINTIKLIEQYRYNGESLKNIFKQKYNLLSIRERDVFQLIIEGKTNKEIANQLNICEKTVKCHVNKIYKKMEVISKKELINYNSDI